MPKDEWSWRNNNARCNSLFGRVPLGAQYDERSGRQVFTSEYRVLRTAHHMLSGMSHHYANNFSVSNIGPAERYLMRDLPIVSTVAIGWSNQNLS